MHEVAIKAIAGMTLTGFMGMYIHMDKRFDEMKSENNKRFDEMKNENNKRFDEMKSEINDIKKLIISGFSKKD